VIRGDDATDVVNVNGPLTFAADRGLADRADVQGPSTCPMRSSDIAASGAGIGQHRGAPKHRLWRPGPSITTVDGDIMPVGQLAD
jgi:hypothetical protein